MLFNSFVFLIFLPVVFLIYWSLKSFGVKAQNIFILLSSYVFYGFWDWRFLLLIFFSSCVDFILGISIEKKRHLAKYFLMTSLFVNIGLLFVFKYFNFFIDSFNTFSELIGINSDFAIIEIILPVGISFYTFQTLSYTIDIYREKIKPSTNYISFLAFVSFFPQLVAGPIERASNLLPQFSKVRVFDSDLSQLAISRIIWGFFKKVVIADNCASYVNEIFSNYAHLSSIVLVFGAILFAFQIYCDFSGYSDIAIGVAQLFGFKLMMNFNFPYFSRDIAEFWRKWHISLSTWFRDYLYIPLGGSRGNIRLKIRNVFAIFLVSGFWHGANWTFIAWGAINALFFLPLLLGNKNRKNINSNIGIVPNAREAFSILGTFSITTIAWIFFRSDSISDAYMYISRMFSFISGDISLINFSIVLLILIFVLIEWFYKDEDAQVSVPLHFSNKKIQLVVNASVIVAILMIGNISNSSDFIYFQF